MRDNISRQKMKSNEKDMPGEMTKEMNYLIWRKKCVQEI